jgi:serine/threonine protein kinase
MKPIYLALEDYSLKFLPRRSDCEKLVKEYKIEKEKGKGSYGTVYDVCKNNKNCKFVLKVTKFNKSTENLSPYLTYEFKFKEWIKEVDNNLQVIECQKNFQFQFVPYVYDAWFCHEKNGDVSFFILMERFDGNLKDFIKIFSKSNYEEKILLKSFIITKLEVLKIALDNLHKKCKICLDDIKLENILYKKNINNTYDLVFSDFGTSSYGKNLTQNCIEKDIRRFNDSIYELSKNFDKYI